MSSSEMNMKYINNLCISKAMRKREMQSDATILKLIDLFFTRLALHSLRN